MVSVDQINSRQKKYWEYLSPQVSRVLSQLDRRPFSSTFGCFDRKFWHQRIIDFPSASQQQGIEVLAHLWAFETDSTLKKQLLQWIQGAVQFTCRLQKWDGSFDEWYFNERGWAGPTAYIMNSIFEAWRLTGSHWSDLTTQQLQRMFSKGARYLIKYEEKDVLSNHQALAVLAISQAKYLLKEESLSEGLKKIKNQFLQGCHEKEGWSLEYDGADPGYQTATISFLARLHELTGEDRWKELAQRQIQFVSLFIFPDGSFARGVGSRSTSVVFHFGLEYWGQWIPIAKRLSCDLLKSLIEEKILGSHTQEDHYLLYRLPEMMKAMTVALDTSEVLENLPFENKKMNIILEGAGLFAFRKGDLYVVGNMKFGLRCLIFHVPKGELYFQQGDIFIQSGVKLKTSGHSCSDIKIEEKNIKVVTVFRVFKNPVFSPLQFLAFRLFFIFFGFHPSVSMSLKNLIRRVLMFSWKEKGAHVVRIIDWEGENLILNTKVIGVKSDQVIYETVEFPSRYVPQSNYSFSGCHSRAQIQGRSQWTQELPCVE